MKVVELIINLTRAPFVFYTAGMQCIAVQYMCHDSIEYGSASGVAGEVHVGSSVPSLYTSVPTRCYNSFVVYSN